tara:strand:+ start:194 stop:2164 length:1971 start_codon:yes stop_codon:yes gene_type:complete
MKKATTGNSIGMPLTVQNNTFAVTQAIENGDSGMMIRELLENAINAANMASNGGLIQIKKFNPHVLGLSQYGKSKLAIWNNGEGMDEYQLDSYSNLFSSGKTQSMQDHFGSGGQIASLKSNKSGLMYISCKDGEVRLVILGKIDESAQGEPIYGKFDLTGDQQAVITLSDKVIKDADFDTSEDWTMVVLGGNKDSQNTIKEPFGKEIRPGWLINDIFTRFFRINGGNIKLDFLDGVGVSKGSTLKDFKPASKYIKDRATKFPDKMREEWVNTTQGIKIWYVSDGAWDIEALGGKCRNGVKPTSIISNPATRGIFSGIVHKNEVYAVSEGKTWSIDATYLGIKAGAKYLRIFVELPDNYDCQTDLYRKVLNQEVHVNGRDIIEPLNIRDFAQLIYDNRPDWFIDKCKEFDTALSSGANVIKRLNELLTKLQIEQSGKKEKRAPRQSKQHCTICNQSSCVCSKTPRKAFSGIRIPKNLQKAPKQRECPTMNWIAESEIENYGVADSFGHRAGEFSRNKNVVDDTIFLNGSSQQFNELEEDIKSIFSSELKVDTFDITDAVTRITKETMEWIVGSTVCRALACEGRPGWTSDDIDKIASPESLTLAADDWESHSKDYRQDVREVCRQLNLQKSEPHEFSDAYKDSVRIPDLQTMFYNQK